MQHIVIAEDEEDVREFLWRAFSRYAPHAQISACPNGAVALELIRSRGADLLISDHRMPQMTGVELLRDIRSTDRDLPIVIISADVTVEMVAVEAGATVFMYKPLSMVQIRSIVETWLGQAS